MFLRRGKGVSKKCPKDISQEKNWFVSLPFPYKKSLGIPWKSLDFSWKISKESEKSKDFQKLGKGAKIQGFLGYFPRNKKKLGFHESVILFSNIQGFPGKARKLGTQFPRKAWKTWKARIISFQAFQGNPWILLNKFTLSWNPSFLGFLGICPRHPWIFAPFPSFWKSLDFSNFLEISQEKSKDFQGISKLFCKGILQIQYQMGQNN